MCVQHGTRDARDDRAYSAPTGRCRYKSSVRRGCPFSQYHPLHILRAEDESYGLIEIAEHLGSSILDREVFGPTERMVLHGAADFFHESHVCPDFSIGYSTSLEQVYSCGQTAILNF
eukprot:IDg10680t1